MTSQERQRHNAIVGGIYILIAQIRYDIDQPGYDQAAAKTLREIGRLAYGEAHALHPEHKEE
jgi:hypothetical protein